MRTSKIPVAALILFVVASVAPLIVLFATPIASLSVRFEPQYFFSQSINKIVELTLLIGVGAAAFGILPLVLYSWLVSRTDVFGKRFLDAFPIYNRAIPDFVKAIGWVILLNPSNGLVNELFRPIFGRAIFNVFTPWGVVFALVLGGVGGNYLFISGTVKNIDPAAEEASRVGGHSLLRTFVSVTLPSLRQIVLITLIWEFMTGISDFNNPIIFGPPGGFTTLATAIQYYSLQFLPPNYGAAATIGIMYIVITMGTFAAYLYFTRRTFMFQSVRGRVSQVTTHHLRGLGRAAASVYCIAIVFMSFFLPLGALLWLSATIPGRLFRFAGWQNYIGAINYPGMGQAFLNSVMVGIVVVVVTTPLVLFVAYAIFKTHRVSRLAEYLVIMPKGIPDIVLSLSIFLMFISVPFVNNLYGTLVPFVLALVITSAPNMILIISGNMVQVGDELEEASRVGGAGWLRGFIRIVNPLVSRAMFNAIALTFIDSIQSLGSVVLLATPSFFVYITLLLGLYISGDVTFNVVAAASVLITIFLAVCVGIIKALERFVRRSRKVKEGDNVVLTNPELQSEDMVEPSASVS